MSQEHTTEYSIAFSLSKLRNLNRISDLAAKSQHDINDLCWFS